MKRIVYILLLVMLTSTAFAQTDEKADFSATCSTGQVLHYKIIDYGEVNVWYTAPAASNSYFSTLAAMCVATGSEDLVSVSDGACLFYDRLSSIPRGAFSTVTIGEDTYLTDGDLCLRDA